MGDFILEYLVFNSPMIDNNKKTIIYLVRHGQTEWNEQGLILGQSESSLTKLGLEQVRNLRDVLKNIHFEAIFSSDLERALKTAEIIAQERILVVKTSKLLREKRMGKYEGKHTDILKEDNKKLVETYKKLTDEQRWKFKRATDMESLEDISNRLLFFFHKTAPKYFDKTILIVSHEAIIQSLLIHLKWGSQKEVQGGYIENSGYVKLLVSGSEMIIDEMKGVYKKNAIKSPK